MYFLAEKNLEARETQIFILIGNKWLLRLFKIYCQVK